MSDSADRYGSAPIQSLEGLDGMRMRPAMYVGPLDDPVSISRLLVAASCLSLENAVAGRASEVRVSVDNDGTASVWDNGPGVPVDGRIGDRNLIEALFTEMWACRNTKEDAEIRHHLCPISLPCAAGLSEWLIYETAQKGWLWRQRFNKGKRESGLERIDPDTSSWQRVSFHPDGAIFGEKRIRVSDFIAWFRELPVAFPGASITLSDGSSGEVHQLSTRN